MAFSITEASAHAAAATTAPLKDLDLNESTADTATTHNSEDDCSMSTTPSEYSSRGSSSRQMVKVNNLEVLKDNEMGDVPLDEEEEKKEDKNEQSMAPVDLNGTHHTLEQAEDIDDSTGDLSDDSTQDHTNTKRSSSSSSFGKRSTQGFTARAMKAPSRSSASSGRSRAPARIMKAPARTNSNSSRSSRSSGGPAKYMASPKRADSFSSQGSRGGVPKLMSSPKRVTSTGALSMSMNGSERSSSSNATATAPRPKVNCAPKRPGRFAAPRRSKSYSSLKKSSSNTSLHVNAKAAPVMSPKRARKGALGAMLEKNKKGLGALSAANLLDDDDSDNGSVSSMYSKHSGFYPSESVNAETMQGQLSTLDLSYGDHDCFTTRLRDDNDNKSSPLSRSIHGFSRPHGKRKPRSNSFDMSHNKYAAELRLEDLTAEWSQDTPWNTFAKNVSFLGSKMSVKRLGKNFGVMADLMSGRREMTMSTIDENGSDSEELRKENEVHRQKQEEHELVTYLQNMSQESRSVAIRGTMRNMSAESRRIAMEGKRDGKKGEGSERSSRSWTSWLSG